MNTEPLLILDSNFLCYRAFHAMGDLSYGAIKTGVVYGFLKEVQNLQDRFGTMRVAFCFDVGNPVRKQLLECYKQKRHEHRDATEEEVAARKLLRRQIRNLYSEYLPEIGYRNVYHCHGYEADDLIASLVMNLPEEQEIIIVSADGDLLQLLRPNVSIFRPGMFRNPGKVVTLQSFYKEHGIHPKKWARVKAMAGCTSDEIPGIPRIGEKTAAKYLRGELKPTTAAFKAIESKEGQTIIRTNKPIVKLPFEGTPVLSVVEDKITQAGWASVCDKLGLKSLRNTSPLSSREQRKPKASFGL